MSKFKVSPKQVYKIYDFLLTEKSLYVNIKSLNADFFFHQLRIFFHNLIL